ncbi:MAG TPA: DUF2281 domain-containing protein [Bacteroidia bacterium]|nr:DUF2281 domain-containing protein [Bacteroidia bacterium]
MPYKDLNATINALPEELKNQVAEFVADLYKKKVKKPTRKKRGFGSLKGKIKMSKDFDAPLEDFEPYS